MSACFCAPAQSHAPELLYLSNIAGNPVTRVLRLREAEIENRFLALPRRRTHGGTDLPLMAVRILIADDDASIRRLLRRLIENHNDWSVCGDAHDGQDAVGKAAELKPDVVVLDLAMPQMNGFEAARAISRKSPELPILLLTVQQLSKELTREAQHAGFKGAVSKSTGSEVVRAIESLLSDHSFFQPAHGDAFA